MKRTLLPASVTACIFLSGFAPLTFAATSDDDRGVMACTDVNGDLDASGELDFSDAITVLGYLFLDDPERLAEHCAVRKVAALDEQLADRDAEIATLIAERDAALAARNALQDSLDSYKSDLSTTRESLSICNESLKASEAELEIAHARILELDVPGCTDWVCADEGGDAAKVEALEQELAEVKEQLATLSTQTNGNDGNADCLNVEDFGAVGDGQTDSTAAIQEAIDQATAPTGKGCVRFPNGTYMVSQTIQVVFGDYLCGGGQFLMNGESSVLKATAPMNSVLNVHHGGRCLSIERLSLDGGATVKLDKWGMPQLDPSGQPTVTGGFAEHGLTGYKISGTLDRVSAYGAISHGVVLSACQSGRFERCASVLNGGDGCRIQGANASLFEQLMTTQNGGNGISVGGWRDADNTVYSGGCELHQAHSEKNGGHGLQMGLDPVEGQALGNAIQLVGGWFEANRLDGVRVYLPSCTVRDVRITPAGTMHSSGVRLLPAARGCVVLGNRLANNGLDWNLDAGYDSYGTIAIAVDENAPVGSMADHWVEGNHYLNGNAVGSKVSPGCSPSHDCEECDKWSNCAPDPAE